MLLMERGFKVPGEGEKTAFLIEKNMPEDMLSGIYAKAMEMREEGKTVDISLMKKNRKFQKEQLTEAGYSEITEFFNK